MICIAAKMTVLLWNFCILQCGYFYHYKLIRQVEHRGKEERHTQNLLMQRFLNSFWYKYCMRLHSSSCWFWGSSLLIYYPTQMCYLTWVLIKTQQVFFIVFDETNITYWLKATNSYFVGLKQLILSMFFIFIVINKLQI